MQGIIHMRFPAFAGVLAQVLAWGGLRGVMSTGWKGLRKWGCEALANRAVFGAWLCLLCAPEPQGIAGGSWVVGRQKRWLLEAADHYGSPAAGAKPRNNMSNKESTCLHVCFNFHTLRSNPTTSRSTRCGRVGSESHRSERNWLFSSKIAFHCMFSVWRSTLLYDWIRVWRQAVCALQKEQNDFMMKQIWCSSY